jgi:nitrate reductase cytochrome c-type subunit
MKQSILLCLVAGLAAGAVFAAGEDFATLRGRAIAEEGTPPPMAKVENKDIKRKRNYPMQPPTIPHKIDNYQVDLRSNKCLSCHSRSRSEESQAPMVSVTHFMDRDGNFLADVSPRRYFCGQCHVVQTDAKQLVESDFMDVDDLLKASKAK